MDLTHTHTYHHNTTSLSLSSFRTTSVHRSSAYGKDYITSHFAAHKERRLYDTKGSCNTTDGRTDATALFYLAFQAFSLHRLHFFGQRPQAGNGGTKVWLAARHARLVSFCFKYPICTSSALFGFIARFLGALASSVEDFYGGRRFGGTKSGYTRFA